MTPGPNELKAALQRLIDGNTNEADRDAVRTAPEKLRPVTEDSAAVKGGKHGF